ncbi:MAG: pilus assembly protein TadG-related protein [Candidatus Latescibacterota bacterium]
MRRVRPPQLARDQRGAVLIAVAVAIAVLFGFGALSIDVGTLTLTKTQLQNAADAGALAAASALGNSGSQSLATARALEFAAYNEALVTSGGTGFNQRAPATITAADVTFPEPGRVRVQTHRTAATGDPLRTYFLRAVNPSGGLTGTTARASAGFFWVCDVGCLKPWSAPDRWYDADESGTYNPDPDTNPDEFYDPIATGYNENDVGAQITLKLGNGNNGEFGQFWYYAIDYPPIGEGTPIPGADQYREWIAGCVDPSVSVGPGDTLQVEPGNMVGPTRQGVEDVIALDPGAYWDPVNKEVVGSAYAVSPRVVKATFFDPAIGVRDDLSGRKYVVVRDIMVFFLEGQGGGGEVLGRFIRTGAPDGEPCADQSNPTFLYKVSLTE